jgi:hypothetical protein
MHPLRVSQRHTRTAFARSSAFRARGGSALNRFACHRAQFGAFWCVVGVLYILLAMSVVCEDYFVASLAALGEKFGLSDDVNGAAPARCAAATRLALHAPDGALYPVASRRARLEVLYTRWLTCAPQCAATAGATLMAAGSSMPEVFSSFMALANSSTDNSLGMARHPVALTALFGPRSDASPFPAHRRPSWAAPCTTS